MPLKASPETDPRLDALVDEIRGCRICRDEPAGSSLPHEPRPVLRVSSSARICVCGQAPGTRVHASGLPFTDPSGDRLREWMGVTPAEFYDQERIAIIPMGFCFPGLDANGGDLPPRRECAPRWRPRLFDLLPRLELVLLVGLYAQRWHLGALGHASLRQNVENWRDVVSATSPRMVPLPHPSWRNNAWLKRNQWFEAEVVPFLRGEIRRVLEAGDGKRKRAARPASPDPTTS